MSAEGEPWGWEQVLGANVGRKEGGKAGGHWAGRKEGRLEATHWAGRKGELMTLLLSFSEGGP